MITPTSLVLTSTARLPKSCCKVSTRWLASIGLNNDGESMSFICLPCTPTKCTVQGGLFSAVVPVGLQLHWATVKGGTRRYILAEDSGKNNWTEQSYSSTCHSKPTHGTPSERVYDGSVTRLKKPAPVEQLGGNLTKHRTMVD